MAALFNYCIDEEVEIKINNAYATKYDNWSEKEELAKLKARYGNDAGLGALGEDSSSSDEEDEDAQELTEQLEKDFFKTLSCLKQNDPRIYDGSVKFFKEEYGSEQNKADKLKKNGKPMYLRDYERKVIIEQNGKFSEDEAVNRPLSPTLVEEQEEIRKSFKKALQGDDEDGTENEGSSLGGLFEKRKKTSEELKKEEEDYREWLKGEQMQLKDKNTEKELKFLHDYWNDPNLDDNELFLKDYILNKKFLEPEDKNCTESYDLKAHDSDGGFSEDEETIAKQTEFEHKYNFRFEEPDQEFLKRFPRTMENSMRKSDNRRKEKRKQVKERKETEKERMKEDLKRLKALKRKEILEKIEKLKEVTGNPNFGFEEDDVDGNFDPEKHDKRMREIFSNDYYEQEEDELPTFPGVDEELEIENLDDWYDNGNEATEKYEDNEPHCEDPDFNMDCEYNPTAKFQKEVIESTKGRKRHRKSKLAQALTVKKPIFNPNEQSFEKYVDEYYGLDFEDVIGDLPCRFKYRKVVPNSFGLTVEEILMADDNELNRWCSVKRAVQRRPDDVEEYDKRRYERKAKNEEYKKKMIPSLYQTEQEIAEDNTKNTVKRKNKKKKNVKNNHIDLTVTNIAKNELNQYDLQSNDERVLKSSAESAEELKNIKQLNSVVSNAHKKSKKRKLDSNDITSVDDLKSKKKLKCDDNSLNVNKNKMKKKNNTEYSKRVHQLGSALINSNKSLSRRKKRNMRKASLKEVEDISGKYQVIQENEKQTRRKGFSTTATEQGNGDTLSISDARLKAYGLKPKKFKNFLKYGKTV